MQEIHEQRPDCKDIFQRIWDRLDKGDDKFSEHDIGIAELRTNMNNLIKSMDAQTKSIWGMVVTVATIGVGFIIWFIQNQ